jgi:phosphoribosylaminoimidazole (AIR) synthetase
MPTSRKNTTPSDDLVACKLKMWRSGSRAALFPCYIASGRLEKTAVAVVKGVARGCPRLIAPRLAEKRLSFLGYMNIKWDQPFS